MTPDYALLGQILFFTLLGSVGSLLGSALLLFFPQSVRKILLPSLISFAAGTLLGAAFLRLLPESMEGASAAGWHDPMHAVGYWILGGFLLFFVLEKLVIWRHCHKGHGCAGHGSGGTLILVGDGFHNFADGFAIGAAFLVDPALGVTVALAMIAHELPQEVGDFAILLDSGFSRVKAFVWNLLSSLPALVGAALAWWILDDAKSAIPAVLALSCASFIYIAAADLVPDLHKRTGSKVTFQQLALIGLGVALMAWLSASHSH
jgi:zinc and cadmium transporter